MIPNSPKSVKEEFTQRRKEPYQTVDVKNTKTRISNALSRVIPVYVSTNNSREEALVYALLGSQSDVCFIANKVAARIDPESLMTKVSLWQRC